MCLLNSSKVAMLSPEPAPTPSILRNDKTYQGLNACCSFESFKTQEVRLGRKHCTLKIVFGSNLLIFDYDLAATILSGPVCVRTLGPEFDSGFKRKSRI